MESEVDFFRKNIFLGNKIEWNEHIRLRDLSTRLYLSVHTDYTRKKHQVRLTEQPDASTVFEICPMSQVCVYCIINTCIYPFVQFYSCEGI